MKAPKDLTVVINHIGGLDRSVAEKIFHELPEKRMTFDAAFPSRPGVEVEDA